MANKHVVFVDLSYYVFYRWYALMNWLEFSGKEAEFPSGSQALYEKFGQLFESKFKELKKKLKADELVVVKDSPRAAIWRTQEYPDYKATRENTGFDGHAFEVVLGHVLPKLKQPVLGCMGAEADDCIAVLKCAKLAEELDTRVTIVTNDNDYLQLLDDRTEIVDANYKSIASRIPKEIRQACSNDLSKMAAMFLKWKIIKGDISDNIPPIATGLGEKRSLNLALDEDAFSKFLEKTNGAKDRFENNRRLICFNCIPEALKSDIKTICIF